MPSPLGGRDVDEEDPTEITVFPTDITTAWITMDAEHAVDPFDIA